MGEWFVPVFFTINPQVDDFSCMRMENAAGDFMEFTLCCDFCRSKPHPSWKMVTIVGVGSEPRTAASKVRAEGWSRRLQERSHEHRRVEWCSIVWCWGHLVLQYREAALGRMVMDSRWCWVGHSLRRVFLLYKGINGLVCSK